MEATLKKNGVPPNFRRIEGSERRPAKGASLVNSADPKEEISITITLRRRADAPALPDLDHWANTQHANREYLSHEEFAAKYGASKEDIDKAADFFKSKGLKVTIDDTSIARKAILVTGTVAQMSEIFGVKLGMYKSDTETYRGREGYLFIPTEIADIVTGVFGLDNRRMAKRHTEALLKKKKTQLSPAQATVPLTPPQVAKLYQFPTIPATGQTIGLIEFGGGYKTTDINAFFAGLGIAAPALTFKGVDGATNSPGSGDDVEVVLDIDVSGSAAPGSKVAVYFAPWTEQGWVDVITTAVHDAVNKPSALSISWGWPEMETIDGLSWTVAAINAVSTAFQEAAALGVTVFAAAGDHGSDCGIGDKRAHALYPASDPYVTACGGTSISNVSGSTFTEKTWNDNDDDWLTGGGISDVFPVPAWQSSANIPVSANPGGHRGRGIPDIAGNADGASGYDLIVNGSNIGAVGGTSATAPLYAGLVALLNASLGSKVGYLNPTFYGLNGTSAFRDIADGISNARGGAPGYISGPHWDGCTGLGVVNGNALLTAIQPHHNWFGYQNLGGLLTSRPNAVSWGNNRIDVVARGLDSAVWHRWWDGTSWNGWESLGGDIQGAPSICSWATGRLDVFAVGLNHHLWHKWYWNGWSGWEDLGGVLSSEPACVSWGANRIDVVARGLNDSMWHKWFDGTWHNWEDLGGVINTAPAVSSWANGRLDCFARGQNNHLWHKYFDGAWHNWVDVGTNIFGSPAAVSWGANRIDVFFPTQLSSMGHQWWDGAAWSAVQDLGGLLSSDVGAASWQPERLDCFIMGTDSAMYHRWFA